VRLEALHQRSPSLKDGVQEKQAVHVRRVRGRVRAKVAPRHAHKGGARGRREAIQVKRDKAGFIIYNLFPLCPSGGCKVGSSYTILLPQED
jgi:hypothetical protein